MFSCTEKRASLFLCTSITRSGPESPDKIAAFSKESAVTIFMLPKRSETEN